MLTARGTLLVALAVGAVGSLLAWSSLPGRGTLPIGVGLFGLGALVYGLWPARWSAGLAMGGAVVVLARLGLGGALADVLDGSALLACGRTLQAAGGAVAVGAGLVVGARRPPAAGRRTAAPAEVAPWWRDGRAVTIPALLVLSAVGAELLAAYDDSTGDPGQLAFAVVFFAMLYGCPALVVRELARRTGRGWPTMLLLSAAFGLLQAGVIDQALFSDSYGDVRGWEESLRATYVAPLGISAHMAQNFLLGHLVYSFGAPIAVAEALRPSIAHQPWIGWRGSLVAGSAWLVAAGLILGGTLQGEAHASLAEGVVSLGIVAALVVGAFRVGAAERTLAPAPRPGAVVLTTFLAASAASVAPETWLGFGIAVAVFTGGGWLLARAARGSDWGIAHAAAVGTGALLSRGALAFSYYPLVGEVSAERKYAHNVVMLLLVAAAGAYALHRSRHGRTSDTSSAVGFRSRTQG